MTGRYPATPGGAQSFTQTADGNSVQNRHCGYCLTGVAVVLLEASGLEGSRAVQVCTTCRPRAYRWVMNAGAVSATDLPGYADLFTLGD
jgi:hypothetical protein